MEITTDRIKELRDKTGISIMQCRKALEEAQGDMEKALIILQKNSKSIASKKSDRTLGAGTVASYIHGAGTVGSMVLLACETDFVAKNEGFKEIAKDIAMHIAALDPQFLNKESIDENARAKAAEVFAEEVKNKPEAMREQILKGKLDAYFGERTLLDQTFIKNPDMTISGLIEGAVQKFGEKIEVVKFVRYSVS